MYLLGAPKFKIITGHKPLLSMFNKVIAKLPPRIERWVMDMQDVDYELEILRQKKWFPEMNKMVEQEVGQCYECQVTTKEYRQEPLKMTEIPEKPWQVVSVDFGGPYPDGHYNLVVRDKRTRYPEVESVHSTAAKPTKEKLKKNIRYVWDARTMETDNGPPFNSKEFAESAAEEGF